MARDAVRASARPRASSASTSSTNPPANISSTRRAIRASSVGRSMSTPTCTVSGSTYSSRGRLALYGLPVSATTSRARTTRRPLSGRICAAASGSTPASRSCSAWLPTPLELDLELAAQRVVGAGELEAVDDRAGVERRAADQHGGGVAAADVGDRVARPALEERDGRRGGDLVEVEQVVRDPAALGLRQLGRADVHPAVDLHRVGVDDLSPEPLGEVEAQARLARRRGTDEGDDRTRHAPIVAAWLVSAVPESAPARVDRRRPEEDP